MLRNRIPMGLVVGLFPNKEVSELMRLYPPTEVRRQRGTILFCYMFFEPPESRIKRNLRIVWYPESGHIRYTNVGERVSKGAFLGWHGRYCAREQYVVGSPRHITMKKLNAMLDLVEPAGMLHAT